MQKKSTSNEGPEEALPNDSTVCVDNLHKKSKLDRMVTGVQENIKTSVGFKNDFELEILVGNQGLNDATITVAKSARDMNLCHSRYSTTGNKKNVSRILLFISHTFKIFIKYFP